VSKKFPDHPKNPERICWGCDAYCAASDMRCGNGSDRTPHDWHQWGLDDLASTPVQAAPVLTTQSD